MKPGEPLVVLDSKGKRLPHALYCDDPSLTIQSERDSCDINFIVDKFLKTGQLVGNVNPALSYGDVSNVPDYQTALAIVEKASELFFSMDARVRSRFENDPAKMIQFLQNPGNKDEAIGLGLVNKPIDVNKEDPQKEVKA